MRAACGLLLAWTSAGCGTVMNATRLTPPVRLHEQGLGIHIAEVLVSRDVRSEDFSESSRVIVVLDLIADTDALLDLQRAELSIRGVDTTDSTQRPLASGVGQAPRTLNDGEFVPSIRLPGKQHVRAWVAFGNFPPRSTHELPEHIELKLPGGQKLELSRPGQTPVWQGDSQRSSYGTSIWIQGSADETAINLSLSDIRFVAGPLLIGLRYGFGARDTNYRSGAPGDGLVAWNLAIASDVAWPVWRHNRLVLAAFLGVESAFLLSREDVYRRTWVGPSLGLEIASALLVPQHGPFPIDYASSPLGAAFFRLALVHWFGPDREIPSFGYILSAGTAYGN
jgi:hypothetical protein